MTSNTPFTYAIIRKPCLNLTEGITSANLGRPDYEKAREQHGQYVEALKSCGLEVTVLEADEDHPDSVFVEDPALLTSRCAVITNPGAPSRKGESQTLRQAVADFYDPVAIKSITEPGTLEGGDVMQVGSHCYIGLSGRTNEEGARQLLRILEAHGMTGSTIDISGILHLKTGVAYLDNNHLLVSPALEGLPEFESFDILQVEKEEAYAANSVWINGTVLVPSGYPKTKTMIEEAGYETVEVDASEFRKLDGGLSCLSLRF